MTNPRVHEIASELGVSSQTVLELLSTLGERAKASSSSVRPPAARKVRALARELRLIPRVEDRPKNARIHITDIGDELGINANGVQQIVGRIGEDPDNFRNGYPQPLALQIIRRVQRARFEDACIKFPSLIDSHANELRGLFQSLPSFAHRFFRVLLHNRKESEFVLLLEHAVKYGEIYAIGQEHLELLLDERRTVIGVKPDQLFGQCGVLLTPSSKNSQRPGFNIHIWNQISYTELELAFAEIVPVVIEGFERLLVSEIELSRIELRDEKFVGKRPLQSSTLGAFHSVTPAKQGSSSLEEDSKKPETGDSKLTDSPFIRLYRNERDENQDVPSDPETKGTKRPHRVRGHVRQQWYPSVQEHKEIWVDAYQTGESEQVFGRKIYLVRPVRRK